MGNEIREEYTKRIEDELQMLMAGCMVDLLATNNGEEVKNLRGTEKLVQTISDHWGLNSILVSVSCRISPHVLLLTEIEFEDCSQWETESLQTLASELPLASILASNRFLEIVQNVRNWVQSTKVDPHDAAPMTILVLAVVDQAGGLKSFSITIDLANPPIVPYSDNFVDDSNCILVRHDSLAPNSILDMDISNLTDFIFGKLVFECFSQSAIEAGFVLLRLLENHVVDI